LETADLAVFGSPDGCEEWISHRVLPVQKCRDPDLQ
jgi:hypothetical protein